VYTGGRLLPKKGIWNETYGRGFTLPKKNRLEEKKGVGETKNHIKSIERGGPQGRSILKAGQTFSNYRQGNKEKREETSGQKKKKRKGFATTWNTGGTSSRMEECL